MADQDGHQDRLFDPNNPYRGGQGVYKAPGSFPVRPPVQPPPNRAPDVSRQVPRDRFRPLHRDLGEMKLGNGHAHRPGPDEEPNRSYPFKPRPGTGIGRRYSEN